MNYSKKINLIGLVVLILIGIFLAGCQAPTKVELDLIKQNKDSCNQDSDCACGGVDIDSRQCFIGNVLYQQNFVDKSVDCPGFCQAKTKCVVRTCVSLPDLDLSSGVKKTECSADSDCIVGGCSGQICQSKNLPPEFTTCEVKPEYACYSQIKCGCDAGFCNWDKTKEFNLCYEEKVNLHLE
ncbi:eight-cysteine-cluster domain-containing protein [Candidatus Woesearchaeota archaeon]|jgi:eight-cysteine-cluster-containing protein|nr:eight-cysteine-cluster domain-containing protein [Candidatus Woesearchaeota archaeon]